MTTLLLHAILLGVQAPAAQNPSPMVDYTRAHERLAEGVPPGVERTFVGPLDKPVQVFVPARTASRCGPTLDLVIHFHGAAFVAEQAVSHLRRHSFVAVINVGAGGGTYDRAFSDPGVFDALLDRIEKEAAAACRRPGTVGRITLSGFSAGYGAVRAILREPRFFERVSAVLLLDGLHASYVPENTVVAAGGKVDEAALDVFIRFGRAAMRGEKALLITHSEIFPGTFASTTETTDVMVRALGLRRTPVLRWGPGGMQQLCEARSGQLRIVGFAGNTAPDHVDHLHGMPEFLRTLEALRR